MTSKKTIGERAGGGARGASAPQLKTQGTFSGKIWAKFGQKLLFLMLKIQKIPENIKWVLVPLSCVDKQLGCLEGTLSFLGSPGAQPLGIFLILSILNIRNSNFCPNFAQIFPEKVL